MTIKMRIAAVTGSVALMLAATIADARTMGYKCVLSGVDGTDWIQPLVFIGHDEANERVTVSDGAILTFNDGQPIEGRVIRANDKRITFGWLLVAQSATNQKVRMRYRATYVRGTGVFTMTAQPTGYSNMFNRKGSCDVAEIKR
ncbi:hypothetical protein [Cognatishimia sp. F0-27]|uniref:hypothetical protein n=1 Tax=Cognatishimia sp. F0-27 TaxID=2816855 RepID=UPI001D0C6790|nr:hypothetical protein [Cognatishimia sp. F0-27]MCC1494922.1 hypothetical protein [Cognatishimia sp. F0-27]